MKAISLVTVISMLCIVTGAPVVLGQAEALPLVQTGASSVLAGAYNEEQALRGQALYYQHCLNCHGETMGGVDKAPPLTGPQFESTWNNAPLAALHARILTMPPDKPASLSREAAVDILGYILWYNGLPLGNSQLSADAGVLSQIKFQLPHAGQ